MGERHIPRAADDYTEAAASARLAFLAESGITLDHVARSTIDPAQASGNIEHFVGAAQVPLGIAGPLLIHGEHIDGEVLVPMATTEGALVASYNRGMRALRESGGVTCTIVGETMQRSPVFMLEGAREARELSEWIAAHLTQITEVAQSTTRIGRLVSLVPFIVGPLLYLRCNYTTGDAAGQNMVSKATLAACEWIQAEHPAHPRFLLSGNVDTDKKHSQINTLLTRGKRVVAEATLTPEALAALGVDAAGLFAARQVSQLGAFMAGAANNGAHAANALTALFIATGQDVANVAESQSGLVYTRVLENGHYYWSITLPSLIVATHGGGTGLPTQRECLEMLGCSGPGSAARLAEIAAAVVLAGEVSLGSAVLAGDWVAGHERLGRNR